MGLINLRLPDGHLSPHVAEKLRKAGYVLPDYGLNKRIYAPPIDVKCFEVLIRRPMQIAIELARGEADVAIVGLDCIREFPGAELLLDLQKPTTKLALAIPNSERFNGITSFETFIEHICPAGVTIYSEYPELVRRYIAGHSTYKSKYKEPPGLDLGWKSINTKSPISVRLSFGSTEGNDFFVDTVETGQTLKVNGSRSICVLLRSTPWLAASQLALSDPWKRAKIMEFKSNLKTAVNNRSYPIEGANVAE